MAHWLRYVRLPLLLSALALCAVQTSAQDLEDSLDAELDSLAEQEAAEISSPKKTQNVEADEIVLDEGEELDGEIEETPKTAATPAPGPVPVAGDDEEIELDDEPAPAQEELQAEGTIEDEELDIDGEEESVAAPTEPVPAPAPSESIEEELTEVAEETPAPVRTRVSLFDEPNLEFEKRLNRIVKSYDVFSQRDWDELLGAKTPEVYGVQPGDTLWDISQTFFGDGFFWAKLWSQNGVIDNPHKISKGKGIRFIEGNEADAPSIGITETAVLASNSNTISVNALDETVNQPPTYREEVEDEITPEELESGIVLETDELIPAPSIPPASRRAQLLKNLPGSFKEIVPASEIGYDASGLKNVQKIRANEAPTVTLNSFAVDRRPESIGRIEEMETGEELASVGETVLLKLDQPIQVGTSVTFITLRERMSGAPGPTVIVGGVGKIVREISAKKNVYRALVEQSVAGIERGSFVLTQAPPKIVISRRGPRSEIEVSIIGGEYDQNRKILGAGSLVYLNGGASAGLKVGDILGVQSVSDDRRHTKRYPNAARPIGLIKIADVRGKVATAILIESQEEIIVGDRTGGEFPQPKPPVKID